MNALESITLAGFQVLGLIILARNIPEGITGNEDLTLWVMAYLSVVNMIGFFAIKMSKKIAEWITRDAELNN